MIHAENFGGNCRRQIRCGGKSDALRSGFQPGGSWNEFAANDFYFRIGTNGMMAKIKVTINKNLRFDPLACDGVIVSTAAGSTAYNAQPAERFCRLAHPISF